MLFEHHRTHWGHRYSVCTCSALLQGGETQGNELKTAALRRQMHLPRWVSTTQDTSEAWLSSMHTLFHTIHTTRR